jgi:hypothetical protein
MHWMRSLFNKIRSVATGEYFRERARSRAERLAAERLAEEQLEREQVEAAARRAAEHHAWMREERRRQLAQEQASRDAAVAAEREAAEQKDASMRHYMQWQREISQRDPEERIQARLNAPKHPRRKPTKHRRPLSGGGTETNRRRH